MKKLFFIFLALLCLGWASNLLFNREDNVKEKLESPKMLTYIDKTYGVKVQYPDFFDASDTTEPGTARFHYINGNRRDISLVMFVEPNIKCWNIADAISNLSDSTTICMESTEDYYIMLGKLDNGRGSYVEKCFLIDNTWVNYTLYYKPQYEEMMGKLKEMIMKWEPFPYDEL
jgi:hypothetical protein